LLHRVYELREQPFLKDGNNNNNTNLRYDEDFIQKLASLADITRKEQSDAGSSI
jgi:hypothetical protein